MIRWIWLVSRSLLLAATLGALGLAAWILHGLPEVEGLSDRAAPPSNAVYDRNGRLLYEMPAGEGGRHTPVRLAEIPEWLRLATIAAEDASFYRNPGVDLRGLARALWINLRGGEVLSGGSTITQQLARNLLLDPGERSRRSLARKLRETVLAWKLSRRYTKDEILELYLNETYYGSMAYGVEAAAQTYFGKHVRDLDLAECALLAGLPQAPTAYNPLENPEAARKRQAVVLNLMVRQGYITPEEARLASEENLAFASAPFPIRAPHFVMYVRSLLEREVGRERLEEGGLRIYTTLDLDLNEAVRDIVRNRLALLARCNGRMWDCPPGGHNVRNGAVVALDPQTGEILAMVGSPDYFSARIDGAVNGTTALRQPGSSIKPITYAAALASGRWTAASVVWDVRTAFVTREGEPYVPQNYDLRYHGPVRLREALASSYNVVAVKLLDAIGVERMTDLARDLGITTLDNPHLGLAVTLGGGEVRLLELTAAYAAFANGGRAVHPLAVLRVEDARGRVIWSAPSGVGRQVLDERVAYLITDILSDDSARIPTFGEESVLKLSRPAAVKTGTTTDYRGNWTIGYTPELVVGVWVGNADNEPMWEVSGISGAAPIWHDVMELALKGKPPRAFERPAGLVEAEVCALSGKRPTDVCPHRVTELFLPGTEPEEACDMHVRVAIDRATGQPATSDTPPERVIEAVYTLFPREAEEWARQQGFPIFPTKFPRGIGSGQTFEGASPPLTMTAPDAGAVFRLDPGLPLEAQRLRVAARPDAAAQWIEVTLYADGKPLAQFTHPPYTTFWVLSEGTHRFWAEGVDGQGNKVRSREVAIQVVR
ncbi:MAG: penicillin-binding protein 1C [Chloroflexia bacterium]